MERAVIIGSGNLAEALARAVAKSGLKLVQIFARNAARGQQVAALAATQWTACLLYTSPSPRDRG